MGSDYIVAAHILSRGAGGRADDIVPMRYDLHQEQHRKGLRSLCYKYGTTVERLLKHAKALRARYLAEHPAVEAAASRLAPKESA
jgi:hypothetical protein